MGNFTKTELITILLICVFVLICTVVTCNKEKKVEILCERKGGIYIQAHRIDGHCFKADSLIKIE